MGDAPPAIVITAFGSMDSAVKTVHELGAFWFLEKPIQASALEALVRRAASHGRLRNDNRSLETQLRYKGSLGELVGVSSKMQEIFALLQQAGPSKACVLITGESGTGKEMVARALHKLSPRRQRPVPRHQLRGAAGEPDRKRAVRPREGIIHRRHRALGRLLRAGAERDAAARRDRRDARRDAGQAAAHPRGFEGAAAWRQERIRGGRACCGGDQQNTRRRRQDVERCARISITASTSSISTCLRCGTGERISYRSPSRSLRCSTSKHECRVTGIAPDVQDMFRAHSWPGNVRELRNVLERAVILAAQGSIERRHLSQVFHTPSTVEAPQVEGDCIQFRVGSTVEEAERGLILRTLEHTKNNKTKAAEILGISLKTLHNKLKEYGATAAVAGE